MFMYVFSLGYYDFGHRNQCNRLPEKNRLKNGPMGRQALFAHSLVDQTTEKTAFGSILYQHTNFHDFLLPSRISRVSTQADK